ncbi:hypothetical protein ACFL1X_06185 [Candidatus Hydrogenedentota bacterium]
MTGFKGHVIHQHDHVVTMLASRRKHQHAAFKRIVELAMTFPNIKVSVAKNLGVDHTFTKPFNVNKVVTAVGNLVG